MTHEQAHDQRQAVEEIISSGHVMACDTGMKSQSPGWDKGDVGAE